VREKEARRNGRTSKNYGRVIITRREKILNDGQESEGEKNTREEEGVHRERQLKKAQEAVQIRRNSRETIARLCVTEGGGQRRCNSERPTKKTQCKKNRGRREVVNGDALGGDKMGVCLSGISGVTRGVGISPGQFQTQLGRKNDRKWAEREG